MGYQSFLGMGLRSFAFGAQELRYDMLPLYTCDYGRWFQGGIWRIDWERTTEVLAVLFTVGPQHVITEHQGVISRDVCTES